jgi:hypothetical protein
MIDPREIKEIILGTDGKIISFFLTPQCGEKMMLS